MSLRVWGEEEPWPGPRWEPVVHDGIFPLIAEPGDIYINRHKDPPLIYLFNSQTNCEMVSAEELNKWVAGGLMKRPTLDRTRSSLGKPSQSSAKHSTQP